MIHFVLVLAGMTTALLQAQIEGSEARGVRRTAAAADDRDYIWTDAYATPDPHGPTVHCKGDGMKCRIPARLLTPARLGQLHDTTLQEATVEANQLLARLQRSAPPGKALCLYRSVHGPVLLWTQPGPGRGAASGPPGRAITDPQAIADLLGIQPPAGRAAGGTLEALLEWDPVIKAYVWVCPRPGNNCVIHPKLSTATSRTVFDDTLAQATEQLNGLFDRVARRPPRPGVRLCLLFLPAGPVLAWTSEGPADASARQQRISADSPEFDRLSRELLGLQ